MCNANYEIIMAVCNSPGSTNDRAAWRLGRSDKVMNLLPEGYYIEGDAAYEPTEKCLVPYPNPGPNDKSRDAFNFYLSQLRMSMEQTFGIMVIERVVLKYCCISYINETLGTSFCREYSSISSNPPTAPTTPSFTAHAFCNSVTQVQTWGILWKPLKSTS